MIYTTYTNKSSFGSHHFLKLGRKKRKKETEEKVKKYWYIASDFCITHFLCDGWS